LRVGHTAHVVDDCSRGIPDEPVDGKGDVALLLVEHGEYTVEQIGARLVDDEVGIRAPRARRPAEQPGKPRLAPAGPMTPMTGATFLPVRMS
jgi:hypothetical protein